jgi:hypothetical protein
MFSAAALCAPVGAIGGSGANPELLVNGGFANSDNWTGIPTIAGGKLTFVEGDVKTQTLVGGSVPAGNFVGTIDIDANTSDVFVILLGAADEQRGNETFSGGATGVALPVTITADGEVSKYQIGTADAAVVDNVTLAQA